MIKRENHINPSSKAVKFAVSYGSPDIRRFVQMYIDTCTMGDGDLIVSFKSSTVTEADIRNYLEKTPYIFGWVDEAWRKQLSAWAFKQMIDEDFLLPSATTENTYIFADKCYIKPGRPRGS